MSAAGPERHTDVERRTIQGRETLIRRRPDEVYIEWRPGRPVYFGVKVGDHIKDADRDVESAHITEWEIIEITPDHVVGVNQRTGERMEWDRAELEQGLVLQRYATNLSEFATLTVHSIGGWSHHESKADTDSQSTEPTLSVVVFGNNGEKYGQQYRFVDSDEAATVELVAQDPSIERLTTELQTRLNGTVRQALEEDGYSVV